MRVSVSGSNLIWMVCGRLKVMINEGKGIRYKIQMVNILRTLHPMWTYSGEFE